MVSQVCKLSELQKLLVDGLRQLPQEWALTPVYGDSVLIVKTGKKKDR
jgi:hypothetical protein